MTKRERMAEALIIRNRALELAETEYRALVEELQLPRFAFDWTPAMHAEAHRQDLLIAPIRDAYNEARRKAWDDYRKVKGE
jgi:hypothetical protein